MASLNGTHIFGAVIFVFGVLLFLGNELGFFPTIPFAGFLFMTIGGFMWKVAKDWSQD